MATVRPIVRRWGIPAPVLLFALLFAAPVLPAGAQNQSAPAGQTTPPDYRQRQTQPPLDVDRDPVPSPDYEAPILPEKPGTPVNKSGNNLYTLQENVNEVLLNCTVVDDKNRLVKGLRQGDFQVWEDGVPQNIASFVNQDVPVSMGILVDDSGSMIGKRGTASEAALDLIRDSNRQDNAFIVNFNQNAYLDTGLTSNVDVLRAGLAHYDDSGMTALYDAVAASADELAHHATQPKQVLLIITDGSDDASRLTLQQAVERVQRLGGPVVYSIGLLYDAISPEDAASARNSLETLSRETGGLAFFPRSPDEIDRVVAQIALDIRNQYTIGYHPTRSPSLGGFRTVRIEAHDRHYGTLVVRTTRGYYPRQIPQMHETAQVVQTSSH
ncbi:MAG: VWA domain-containing protein [Acidobacteriaceae bacterium]